MLSQNRILEAAVSGKKDMRLLAYLGIDGDMAPRVAKQFAGSAHAGQQPLIISATFPISRIIGTARTGYGCLNENEFVVLNGPGNVTIRNVQDVVS